MKKFPGSLLGSVFALVCAGVFANADASEGREDAWGGIRLFEAPLSASNQTTLTESDGIGLAKFTFDIETHVLNWEVTYEDLTSPPMALHIHGPSRPGLNAEELFDLGGNGLDNPIIGSLEIGQTNTQYLFLGRLYVLLKSVEYPNGELRGRIDAVPPPGFKRTVNR